MAGWTTSDEVDEAMEYYKRDRDMRMQQHYGVMQVAKVSDTGVVGQEPAEPRTEVVCVLPLLCLHSSMGLLRLLPAAGLGLLASPGAHTSHFGG